MRTLENKDCSNPVVLIDERSLKEFTAEILALPEYPTEHTQRRGHIPGAHTMESCCQR
jgi:3-mercaptopyruvate sulfurtransferase SseA